MTDMMWFALTLSSYGVQAIQKGSIDSCREAHEDWLAKVQATLAAPTHVIAPPTHSNLASLQSLHPSRRASYCDTTQVRKLRLAVVWRCTSAITYAHHGKAQVMSPTCPRPPALLAQPGPEFLSASKAAVTAPCGVWTSVQNKLQSTVHNLPYVC